MSARIASIFLSGLLLCLGMTLFKKCGILAPTIARKKFRHVAT
jgi:hypothetical protein